MYSVPIPISDVYDVGNFKIKMFADLVTNRSYII